MLLACLVLSGSVAAHLHFANVTFDDAFISFRYAENLARGDGLVFNPGERVEGYSNFLWTVLLALPLLGGLFPEDEVGLLALAKGLGALFSLMSVLLLWHTSRSTSRTSNPGGPFELLSWVGPAYVAALPAVAIWGVGALETPLVSFLLLLCVHLHLREDAAFERQQKTYPLSYVALFLAALTRPEPVALALPLAALRWLRRWRRLGFGRATVDELRSVLWFLIPYGTFLLFRYGYYGELLPNTYYSKLHDDPEAWARGARYLAAAARDFEVGFLAVAGLLALALARRMPYRVQCTLLLVATWSLVVAHEGGDWMPVHRMLVPVLPLVGFLVGELARAVAQVEPRHLEARWPAWLAPPRWTSAWNDTVERIAARPGAWKRLRWGAGTFLVAALAANLVGQHRGLNMQTRSGWRGIELGQGLHFGAARWMRRELSALDGTQRRPLLALGEAGVVPYVTRFPVLDLFGLTDRHIARQPGPLHRKFDVDYVLARRPEYVFLLAQRAPEGHWFSDHHHATVLLQNDRFQSEYAVLRDFGGAVLLRRVPADGGRIP